MKNFEKYEKELKEAVASCDLFGFLYKITGEHFNNSKGDIKITEFIDWLYEEYKEPLLTEEEREYIRNFFLSKFVEKKDVKVTVDINGCLCFLINGNANFFTSYMPYDQTEDGNKNLKHAKYYTLEELGL